MYQKLLKWYKSYVRFVVILMILIDTVMESNKQKSDTHKSNRTYLPNIARMFKRSVETVWVPFVHIIVDR